MVNVTWDDYQYNAGAGGIFIVMGSNGGTLILVIILQQDFYSMFGFQTDGAVGIILI